MSGKEHEVYAGANLVELVKSLDVDINDLGSNPASIELLVSFKNRLTLQKKKKHEVYGGEIPDEEGEMGIHNTQYEMPRGDYDAVKEAEEMRKRYQEEEMASQQDAASLAAAQASKEEADARSVFVGNVDYACTPEEVQQLFQTCGTVNRVTILTDKFGQPKGFAYVEFQHPESVQDALQLNESELHGRQLKVLVKRTNVPGMKQQFRAQGFNPYGGSRFRRPYVTPYPSYGYGKMPRYRRPPMGYSPYAYY